MLVVDDTQAVGVLGRAPPGTHPSGPGGGGTFRWLGAPPGGRRPGRVAGKGLRGTAGRDHRPGERVVGRLAAHGTRWSSSPPSAADLAAARPGDRRRAGERRAGDPARPAGAAAAPRPALLGARRGRIRLPGGDDGPAGRGMRRRTCTALIRAGVRTLLLQGSCLRPAGARLRRHGRTRRRRHRPGARRARRRTAGPASDDAPVVIDAHCHAGTGDGLSGPWDTSAPLDGVPAPGGRRRDHAHRAVRDPHLRLRAGEPAGRPDRRQAPQPVPRVRLRQPGDRPGPDRRDGRPRRGPVGVPGIKVHWRDGRITREIADVARSRRLPVLYDPRGDTATVEMVARAYPDVAWIIPHLSSFADDWKAQVAFVDQLTRLPERLHGHLRRPLLRRARRRRPPGRPAQDPLRQRRPLPAPGGRAGQGARARRWTRPAGELVLGGNLCRLVRGVRRTPCSDDRGGHPMSVAGTRSAADLALREQAFRRTAGPGCAGDQAAQRGRHQGRLGRDQLSSRRVRRGDGTHQSDIRLHLRRCRVDIRRVLRSPSISGRRARASSRVLPRSQRANLTSPSSRHAGGRHGRTGWAMWWSMRPFVAGPEQSLASGGRSVGRPCSATCSIRSCGEFVEKFGVAGARHLSRLKLPSVGARTSTGWRSRSSSTSWHPSSVERPDPVRCLGRLPVVHGPPAHAQHAGCGRRTVALRERDPRGDLRYQRLSCLQTRRPPRSDVRIARSELLAPAVRQVLDRRRWARTAGTGPAPAGRRAGCRRE